MTRATFTKFQLALEFLELLRQHEVDEFHSMLEATENEEQDFNEFLKIHSSSVTVHPLLPKGWTAIEYVIELKRDLHLLLNVLKAPNEIHEAVDLIEMVPNGTK